ncbi:hypothetical protein POM88_052774 [Heracleum sosnowskyi]|uniref:PB1 domain-containing protein n=1 Tax=Heracleum sosnowskyi TaxID=360622 RepID=A0AAD8LXN5_9APIA|nr:hypothetical protein POM88_052774 [Heracleum sosnowskyi]
MEDKARGDTRGRFAVSQWGQHPSGGGEATVSATLPLPVYSTTSADSTAFIASSLLREVSNGTWAKISSEIKEQINELKYEIAEVKSSCASTSAASAASLVDQHSNACVEITVLLGGSPTRGRWRVLHLEEKIIIIGAPPMENTAISLTMQNMNEVTVKAVYRGVILRFELPLSSGMRELEGNLIERLHLEREKFSIKYQDEEGDWVLIACEKDIQKCKI